MMGKEKGAVAQHPTAGTARTRGRAVEQRPPDATLGERDLRDIRHMQPACSLLRSRSHFESIAPDPHAVGSVNQARAATEKESMPEFSA